jgi:hypothetical protein
MALQAIYDSQDQIPEAHRELFSERNGKWELTGITGVRTQADVDRVQGSLTAERNSHKATKDRLRAVHFKGRSVVDMNDDDLRLAVEGLDKYEELEASVGKVDEAKLAQIIETRLRSRLAPIERDRDTARARVQILELADRTRRIHDAVRAANLAARAKLVDTAMEDVLMLAERVFEVGEDGAVTTRSQMGVTPGIGPDVWLVEMAAKRPHWWPLSGGGGARGAGGGNGAFPNNPWSAETWNLTEQGRVIRSLGEQKAQQMAEAAGTTVGGLRPVKKSA